MAWAIQALAAASDHGPRLKHLHTLEAPISTQSTNDVILRTLEARSKDPGITPLRKFGAKNVFYADRADDYFKDTVDALMFMVPEVCVTPV